MKNRIVFLAVIIVSAFICPSNSFSKEPSPLTIKDAILSALTTHPGIKAEKMAYQAQKSTVSKARSGLLPSLDFSGDAGYETVHNSLTRSRKASGVDDDERSLWFNSQTLTLNQLIWDGTRTQSRYAAEKQQLTSSRILAVGAAESVALDTIESYVQVLNARKVIRLARDNIQRLQDLKKKTEMRLDMGKGTQTDVDRVLLTLSDASAVLAGYEGTLRYAMDRFRAVTSASPDLITRGSVKVVSLFDTPEDAVDTGMRNNPSLMVTRSNIEQRRLELASAKAGYHPKISLVGRAMREENIDALKDVDHSLAGLVQVNYNLFNGFGDWASVREGADRVAEARHREEEMMIEVETSIRFEFNNQLTADRQIPFLEKKIEQSVKILESYTEQFLVGKREILEVIDAQKMLFTFQAALENMETGKILSHYRLLGLTGQLFDHLGITFNPEI